MEEVKWVQFQLHTRSRVKQEKLKKQIIPFVDSLGVDFYFNSYSGPKRQYFIKLGLINIDEKMLKTILDKAKELGATVREGDPDLRMEGDMVIDDIKKLSTTVAVKMFKLAKPTDGQIYLFIHFLMNQLGYLYNNELDVYLALAHAVRFGRRK